MEKVFESYLGVGESLRGKIESIGPLPKPSPTLLHSLISQPQRDLLPQKLLNLISLLSPKIP